MTPSRWRARSIFRCTRRRLCASRLASPVNTLDLWSSVSEDVRVPLGAVTSRETVSEELIPGGPRGLSLVRSRTSFENRPDVTETLSLAPEDGTWKVSGYIIE